MKDIVEQIIIETQNDIWDYLNVGVPLEYYHDDIDEKLHKMKMDILKVIEHDSIIS